MELLTRLLLLTHQQKVVQNFQSSMSQPIRVERKVPSARELFSFWCFQPPEKFVSGPRLVELLIVDLLDAPPYLHLLSSTGVNLQL